MISVPLTGPRHVVPEYGMRMRLVDSIVAVPLRAIAQGGRPGIEAVALADHVSVPPESEPLADPEICTSPKHRALKVPDPEVPENSVTLH
jgi:hypothetical protein